jgi:hypothetical protein
MVRQRTMEAASATTTDLRSTDCACPWCVERRPPTPSHDPHFGSVRFLLNPPSPGLPELSSFSCLLARHRPPTGAISLVGGLSSWWRWRESNRGSWFSKSARQRHRLESTCHLAETERYSLVLVGTHWQSLVRSARVLFVSHRGRAFRTLEGAPYRHLNVVPCPSVQVPWITHVIAYMG